MPPVRPSAADCVLATLTDDRVETCAASLAGLEQKLVAESVVRNGLARCPDIHAELVEELLLSGTDPSALSKLLTASLASAFAASPRRASSLLEQLSSRREGRGVACDCVLQLSSTLAAEPLAELLVRVGPRLVLSSPDELEAEATSLLLSSLVACMRCEDARCGAGARLCSVCAVQAVERDCWRSASAPALACCENDEGSAAGLSQLTLALLRKAGVPEAALLTSARENSRPVTVCGLPLTFAQNGGYDAAADGGGSGSTGMVLWGAAALLTWYLEHDAATRSLLSQHRTVLEIGCGLGSVSAAAALLGGAVIATDGDAEVVEQARANIAAALAVGEAAGLQGAARGCEAARLRWGHAEDIAAVEKILAEKEEPLALVLASDVGFFVEAHGALVETLARFGEARKPPLVLMAHTWRNIGPERALFEALEARGCVFEDVTPGEESGAPQPASTRLLRCDWS